MNLAQIVTAIGQRTGQIGPRDVTATRNFVGIRYNQLWQAFLWKDSLVEYVVTIDPDTANYTPTSPYMPTKGHLILPSVIGNVIAVRSNANHMNVERPMMYFRVGQDQFSKTGRPCEYYLLSTCVWEFDAVSHIRLAPANGADLGQFVTVDSLGSDEVTVNRVKTALQAAAVDLQDSDRIDAMLKPATTGAVSLTSPDYGDNLVPSDAVYVNIATTAAYDLTPLLTAGQDYLITFGATEHEITVNGVGYIKTSDPLRFTAQGSVILSANSVGDIGSPVTATVQLVTDMPIATLQPSDTAAPKRQRIRFVRIPDSGLTIRVLGKRITPSLTDDNDVPAVTGMDGILYAMATYDMAHRDEFSKVGAAEAQILLTESVGPNFLTTGVPGGFLKKLIEEETDQSAFNSRIMPENGFGGHDFDEFRPTKAEPY